MTSIGYFKTLKSNGTESKSKKEWLTSQSSFEMGSSRSSDLKLNLPSASPNQASFEFCPKLNQVYIIHHGKPNTTFIGNQSLNKNAKVLIKSGDVISFKNESFQKSFKFEYSQNQENIPPNHYKKGRKSLAPSFKSPKKGLMPRQCMSDRKTRSATKKLMDLESVKNSFKESLGTKLFDEEKKKEENASEESVGKTVVVEEAETKVMQASPVEATKETLNDDVSMEANLMDQIEAVEDHVSIDSIVMSTGSLSDVSAPASMKENQQMNSVDESELPKEIQVDTHVQEVTDLVEEASGEMNIATTDAKARESEMVSVPVEATKSKASFASRYNKTSKYAKSYKNISQALRARAKTDSISKASYAEVAKVPPYQKRAIPHMEPVQKTVHVQKEQKESMDIESIEPFQELTVAAKINRWKSSNPYVQISHGIRSMPNAKNRTQSLKQEENMRNELRQREALKQERIAKENALKAKKAAKEQKRLAKEENRRRHQEAIKKQAEKKAAMLKAQEEARLLLEKEQALEKDRLEKKLAFEREQQRLKLEQAKRVEEARLKAEEEERLRIQAEAEKKERLRIEAEKKAAEEERLRVEAEKEAARLQALEEERLRLEAEEKERLRVEAEKEAARLQALEEERLRLEAEEQEKERLRIEAEKKAVEEERLRLEAEKEAARLQALEEERLRLEAEEQEKERLRIEAEKKAVEEEAARVQALEEERLRLLAEEKERLRVEAEIEAARLQALEEERLCLEAEEKERLRIEAEKEAARLQELEEERIRVEAEQAAEEERLRIETEKEVAEKERLRIEAEEKAARLEEEERLRIDAEEEAARLQAEEEETQRVAAEEKERLRIEQEEQERLRLEAETLQTESSMEEETEDVDTFDFTELSYQELRKECTARGLSSVGKKAVLIERLKESCINTIVEEEEETEEDSKNESIDYSSLKVAELRYLCDERSLEWKGLKKAELVSLLESSEEISPSDNETKEEFVESVDEVVPVRVEEVEDEEVENQVEEDLSSYSYRELQQLCKERKLSAKGKKTELLARLQDH